MHADHPRACGANFRPVSRGCSRFGSSPRVRGKRCKLRQLKQQIRIIPARAGQTHERKEMQKRASDHPRACGANSAAATADQSASGSSPRVRGKLVFVEDAQIPLRIIPARAGQTASVERRGRGQTDHPRACGANRRRSPLLSEMYGSSPRVRGKQPSLGSCMLLSRIIPARAGQTRHCGVWVAQYADHPRACGANCPAGTSKMNGVGSSPRVRGKRHNPHQRQHIHRIIPARAGQTVAVPQAESGEPDHPRACGANLCFVKLL